MKKVFSPLFALSLSLLCITGLTSNAQAESKVRQKIVKLDRIIGVVDQTVITEQELKDRSISIKAQLQKKGHDLPTDEVLQKQILERLIVDSLQLQLAAKTGLKVEDVQLDKTIERIAEQNQLTLATFKQALEADGVPFYKFREDIRNEMIIARLREREVDNRVIVTESEVDNYLTSQSSREGEADEFLVSHILIRLPEDSSPEDLQKAKTRTEQVLKSLQTGMSFEKASSSFSDAPNALEGGDLGWRNAQQLPPAFFEAVKNLKAGELGSSFRSNSGIHILKLNDRRSPSATLVITQTHVRHILIKTNEITSQEQAKQKAEAIKENITQGKKFDEMARQYSEDGSANTGGDLGWVNPGDTLPAFEKVMNALSINEVSTPVQTPFGWHLLEVLERRRQDMSEESTRFKARQEIRARKAEEAYTDWIREMRDSAFIELRLEDKF